MSTQGILYWLFSYMLEHQFKSSRREMAVQLRVSERTLSNAIDDAQAAETALLFEQLLGYAIEHNLPIDDILAQYKLER